MKRIFILLCLTASVALACEVLSPKAEIVCYFEGTLLPSSIDPCKCTLLVVSRVKVEDHFRILSNLDFMAINDLKKKNPYLKVIASLGGDQVRPKTFLSVVSSVERLTNFTEGVATFVNENNLDGVEINWRWPGQSGGLKNKDDLTILMKALRLALDVQVHNVSKRQIVPEVETPDPFSILDLFDEGLDEDFEEITVSSMIPPPSVSLSTTPSSSSTIPSTLADRQLSTITSYTSYGPPSTSESTTTGETSSASSTRTASVNPAEKNIQETREGSDYLLLEDDFSTSGSEETRNLNEQSAESESGQNKEKRQQVKQLGDSRGTRKFKDYFKVNDADSLTNAARRQGARGGGWKLAGRRVIGPAERIIRPLEKRIGASKILMLTVSPRPEYIAKGYDMKTLASFVDMFSVPSENLTESVVASRRNETFTYHHSRLMGVSDIQNADSLLDLIVSMGVPLDRLIMGVPTTGALFTLADTTKNTPRSAAEDKPSWMTYRQVCSLLTSGNWTLERDEDLTGPYAYRNESWLAFEDPVSLRIKSKYALLRGLAGIGIHALDDDDWDGTCSHGPFPLLTSVFDTFTQLARTPRKAVLKSLVRDLETGEASSRAAFEGSSHDLRISPFRIIRIVDRTGDIRAIRSNGVTKYECSRQGYYRDPDDCSLFYRCVKFDQYIDDYTVFEYSCPTGLVFDDRWEICAWPSTAPPCEGSSEIFPVPRMKNLCTEEGYFTDPENCRWFFACRDYYGNNTFTVYEFRCPFGLAYDEEQRICNWPWLVPACGEYEGPVPFIPETRARGKSIDSGNNKPSYKDEKHLFKECLDCDGAEIEIKGEGIYHPEKGIIVASSYFDKFEKLNSLQSTANDREDNKHQYASLNQQTGKDNLQGKNTGKISLGKTINPQFGSIVNEGYGPTVNPKITSGQDSLDYNRYNNKPRSSANDRKLSHDNSQTDLPDNKFGTADTGRQFHSSSGEKQKNKNSQNHAVFVSDSGVSNEEISSFDSDGIDGTVGRYTPATIPTIAKPEASDAFRNTASQFSKSSGDLGFIDRAQEKPSVSFRAPPPIQSHQEFDINIRVNSDTLGHQKSFVNTGTRTDSFQESSVPSRLQENLASPRNIGTTKAQQLGEANRNINLGDTIPHSGLFESHRFILPDTDVKQSKTSHHFERTEAEKHSLNHKTFKPQFSSGQFAQSHDIHGLSQQEKSHGSEYVPDSFPEIHGHHRSSGHSVSTSHHSRPAEDIQPFKSTDQPNLLGPFPTQNVVSADSGTSSFSRSKLSSLQQFTQNKDQNSQNLFSPENSHSKTFATSGHSFSGVNPSFPQSQVLDNTNLRSDQIGKDKHRSLATVGDREAQHHSGHVSSHSSSFTDDKLGRDQHTDINTAVKGDVLHNQLSSHRPSFNEADITRNNNVAHSISYGGGSTRVQGSPKHDFSGQQQSVIFRGGITTHINGSPRFGVDNESDKREFTHSGHGVSPQFGESLSRVDSDVDKSSNLHGIGKNAEVGAISDSGKSTGKSVTGPLAYDKIPGHSGNLRQSDKFGIDGISELSVNNNDFLDKGVSSHFSGGSGPATSAQKNSNYRADSESKERTGSRVSAQISEGPQAASLGIRLTGTSDTRVSSRASGVIRSDTSIAEKSGHQAKSRAKDTPEYKGSLHLRDGSKSTTSIKTESEHKFGQLQNGQLDSSAPTHFNGGSRSVTTASKNPEHSTAFGPQHKIAPSHLRFANDHASQFSQVVGSNKEQQYGTISKYNEQSKIADSESDKSIHASGNLDHHIIPASFVVKANTGLGTARDGGTFENYGNLDSPYHGENAQYLSRNNASHSNVKHESANTDPRLQHKDNVLPIQNGQLGLSVKPSFSQAGDSARIQGNSVVQIDTVPLHFRGTTEPDRGGIKYKSDVSTIKNLGLPNGIYQSNTGSNSGHAQPGSGRHNSGKETSISSEKFLHSGRDLSLNYGLNSDIASANVDKSSRLYGTSGSAGLGATSHHSLSGGSSRETEKSKFGIPTSSARHDIKDKHSKNSGKVEDKLSSHFTSTLQASRSPGASDSSNTLHNLKHAEGVIRNLGNDRIFTHGQTPQQGTLATPSARTKDSFLSPDDATTKAKQDNSLGREASIHPYGSINNGGSLSDKSKAILTENYASGIITQPVGQLQHSAISGHAPGVSNNVRPGKLTGHASFDTSRNGISSHTTANLFSNSNDRPSASVSSVASKDTRREEILGKQKQSSPSHSTLPVNNNGFNHFRSTSDHSNQGGNFRIQGNKGHKDDSDLSRGVVINGETRYEGIQRYGESREPLKGSSDVGSLGQRSNGAQHETSINLGSLPESISRSQFTGTFTDEPPSNIDGSFRNDDGPRNNDNSRQISQYGTSTQLGKPSPSTGSSRSFDTGRHPTQFTGSLQHSTSLSTEGSLGRIESVIDKSATFPHFGGGIPRYGESREPLKGSSDVGSLGQRSDGVQHETRANAGSISGSKSRSQFTGTFTDGPPLNIDGSFRNNDGPRNNDNSRQISQYGTSTQLGKPSPSTGSSRSFDTGRHPTQFTGSLQHSTSLSTEGSLGRIESVIDKSATFPHFGGGIPRYGESRDPLKGSSDVGSLGQISDGVQHKTRANVGSLSGSKPRSQFTSTFTDGPRLNIDGSFRNDGGTGQNYNSRQISQYGTSTHFDKPSPLAGSSRSFNTGLHTTPFTGSLQHSTSFSTEGSLGRIEPVIDKSGSLPHFGGGIPRYGESRDPLQGSSDVESLGQRSNGAQHETSINLGSLPESISRSQFTGTFTDEPPSNIKGSFRNNDNSRQISQYGANTHFGKPSSSPGSSRIFDTGRQATPFTGSLQHSTSLSTEGSLRRIEPVIDKSARLSHFAGGGGTAEHESKIIQGKAQKVNAGERHRESTLQSYESSNAQDDSQVHLPNNSKHSLFGISNPFTTSTGKIPNPHRSSTENSKTSNKLESQGGSGSFTTGGISNQRNAAIHTAGEKRNQNDNIHIKQDKNHSTGAKRMHNIAIPQGKSISPHSGPFGSFIANNSNISGLRKITTGSLPILARFNIPHIKTFGSGGVRAFDDDIGPEVCERAGLFRHPDSCEKFYECYWDRWLEKFTLHVFDCPVTIIYDSGITACNWPFNGPICIEDEHS